MWFAASVVTGCSRACAALAASVNAVGAVMRVSECGMFGSCRYTPMFFYHRRPFSVMTRETLGGQKMASSSPLRENWFTQRRARQSSLDRMSKF